MNNTRLPAWFVMFAASLATVRAETWPTIEQLAAKAVLIVHGRASKGSDGSTQFAVIETWKGSDAAETFAPDKAALSEGETVLIFTARNLAGGKFTRPDVALPVVNGKVTYPGSTADAPGKEYALRTFKDQLQAAMKSPLVNGGFDDSPVGVAPEGWKEAYPNGAGIVTSEGKDTFLRLASATGANAGMSQEVAVSPKATDVVVLGRMRGKPRNAKEEKRAAVEVVLRYLDAKGATISTAIVASESSPNWRTFRKEFKLPPGCAKVEVVARSVFAAGTFDFDTVRVEFK
jgi:hypothetical protein